MNETNTKSKPLTSGKIVHRLPGRMRVRIDRLHDDISYGNDLQQAATALKGVIEVRVNALASSIIITYRTIELSAQNVLDCLGVSFPIVGVVTESIEHPSADRSDVPSDVNSIAQAEKLTAKITSEVIGETVGEIVGETVGELFMGPAGMLIGAELGGKLGAEIGDLIEESFLPESSANKPKPPNPPERNNQRHHKRGK